MPRFFQYYLRTIDVPAARDFYAAVLGRSDAVIMLNTADLERARATYTELFGWEAKEPLDLGALGEIHPFAWRSGGAAVGAMADIASRPGVHPHWLFHFRVASLDTTALTVKKGGGKVLGPFALPDGGRVAVCDDPQGAAFALIEARV